MRRILFLAFLVSGFAGLVYETVWSRYLALFVGHSAYAQVIVLTIFLGGLSVGALLVGRRSERIARPLLAYAGVEAVVGVTGLLFHTVFVWLTEGAYASLLPALEGVSLTAVRWGIAVLMILPQSVLMGTTFPLMSAALLRDEPERPGRTLGLLYFFNSFGAAVGGVTSGFVMVGALGLPGTLAAAGVLNLLVALASFVLSRSVEADARHLEPARVPIERGSGAPPDRLWRALLVLSAGTAVASFIYEIVWIRMLSLVLGSATHAFEIMLSAFILGIALGALWIERRADDLEDPLGTLAVIQWAMGFAALATLPVYLASFDWTAALVASLQPTEGGYRAFNAARYVIALTVMLPSTLCAGMTLPLITRILLVSGRGERAVGWVYGVNTLGSIVGVVVASLLLLPLLGLELLLLTGAGLDMLLGVGVLHLRSRASVDPSTPRAEVRGAKSYARGPAPDVLGGWLAGLSRPRLLRLAYGLTAVVLAGVALATRMDPVLLTSGVFRSGEMPGVGADVLYYKDGRTATVSVVEAAGVRWIATNGKADASVRSVVLRPDTIASSLPMKGDEPTQLLLGLLPLVHNPDARNVAVVGQGSGMTSHYVLASPTVERVTTIEIEPAMIEGSRTFYPANRRVFDDPRSTFVVDDARAVLASRPGRFDAIVSEPSNPWVSGVSSLFTREFYARVHDRLAPGGVFVQWLQIYEISDDLALSVLAALHEHFPSYRIYTSTGDLIIVAGADGTLPEPDWSVLELEGFQEDLRRVPTLSPTYLSMLTAADRAALAPLLDGWPRPNSDFDPVLDLGAERSRFIGDWAADFLFLGAGPLHVVSPHLPPIRALQPAPAPFPEIRRVAGLALNASLREVLEEGRRGGVGSGSTGGDASARGGPPAAGSVEGPIEPAVVRLARFAGNEELPGRAYEVTRFRAVMESGRAPSDWLRWTREAERVAEILHDGLTGVADQGFFDEVAAYLAATEAPPRVYAALGFLRATYAWAFRSASRDGDVLLAEFEADRRWLAPELVLDGLVTARLQLGDIEGARRAYTILRPLSSRAASDIRIRLLEAHLDAAERRQEG